MFFCSWTCLRVQHKNTENSEAKEQEEACKLKSTNWCLEADDWGNDDNNFNLGTSESDFQKDFLNNRELFADEQNCNIFSNNDKVSEDEESSSFEDSVMSGLGSLSIDERNANNGAQGK